MEHPYATRSAQEPSGVRHHPNAILRENSRGARLSKEKEQPAPPRRRASRCPRLDIYL
jgi:hypothetical protein